MDHIGATGLLTPAEVTGGVLQVAFARLSLSVSHSAGDRYLLARLPRGAIPLAVRIDEGPALPAGFVAAHLGTSASVSNLASGTALIPGAFNGDGGLLSGHAISAAAKVFGTQATIAPAAPESPYENIYYTYSGAGAQPSLGHYFDAYIYYTVDAMG